MLRKLCSIGVADELNRFNAFYAQAQRLHHSVATASPLSGQRFNLSCRTTVAIDQEPARHDESSDSDKALLMSAERWSHKASADCQSSGLSSVAVFRLLIARVLMEANISSICFICSGGMLLLSKFRIFSATRINCSPIFRKLSQCLQQ